MLQAKNCLRSRNVIDLLFFDLLFFFCIFFCSFEFYCLLCVLVKDIFFNSFFRVGGDGPFFQSNIFDHKLIIILWCVY